VKSTLGNIVVGLALGVAWGMFYDKNIYNSQYAKACPGTYHNPLTPPGFNDWLTNPKAGPFTPAQIASFTAFANSSEGCNPPNRDLYRVGPAAAMLFLFGPAGAIAFGAGAVLQNPFPGGL
jgi:hypothetical protein